VIFRPRIEYFLGLATSLQQVFAKDVKLQLAQFVVGYATNPKFLWFSGYKTNKF